MLRLYAGRPKGAEAPLNDAARIIRHVSIRGRVQGVGFRAFVEDEARRRALEGWVRNRRDGSVEALFAGPQQVVEDMIGACRVGPPIAQVEALDAREGNDDDLGLRRRGDQFSSLPTL
jgi:acylphosphatase